MQLVLLFKTETMSGGNVENIMGLQGGKIDIRVL